MSLTDDALEQVEKLFRENQQLREQLAAANERAETLVDDVEKLHARVKLARSLMDLAKLGRTEARDENDKLRLWLDELGYDALAVDQRLRTGETRDLAGWSAEENAEWDKHFGPKTAAHLRAANNRVWAVVQELREVAVAEDRDPHQDPMAQRLSAALVGAADPTTPDAAVDGHSATQTGAQ